MPWFILGDTLLLLESIYDSAHFHFCHAKPPSHNIHRFQGQKLQYSMNTFQSSQEPRYCGTSGILYSDTQGKFDTDIDITGFM